MKHVYPLLTFFVTIEKDRPPQENGHSHRQAMPIRWIALLILLFISSGLYAGNLGQGRVSSVVGQNGACVQSTTNNGGPQFWDIAEGNTYTITLSDVTDVANGGTDATIQVIVKSSSSGNTCHTATKQSTGVYTFTYTLPATACATLPIRYFTQNCAPNTGKFARHNNLSKPKHLAHLRAANFNGSCAKVSDDNSCGFSCPPITTSVSVSGPTTFCEGDSVVLSASGADAYLWSTGDTTESITVTEDGIYTVFGTSSQGCPSSNNPTINVTVHPLPEVSISGNNNMCPDDSVTLVASGASSYLWSTGETTTSIVVTIAGAYSVTGTDANGCTASSSVNVSLNTPPTVGILTSGSTTFCPGDSVMLMANGAFSYLWSTGETTQIITAKLAGTYSVTGTDINGCSATASVNVALFTPPTVSISGDNSFCLGGSTVLTASGASSYLWSTGETTVSIVVASAGSYSVTGTDGNGCSGSASKSVSVNNPPSVGITASGNIIMCMGDSVTLTANGATTYLWSTGETTASIVVKMAGNYSVTGTDANGCTATASTSVTTNPQPVVTVTGFGAFCPQDSVILTVSGALSYLWHTGETTPSIVVYGPGVCWVIGTDANGCSSTATVNVLLNANFTTDITPPVDLPVCGMDGNSLCATATGGNVYSWSLSSTDNSWQIDGSTSGTCINYTAGNNGTVGTFIVTVTDTLSGCSDSDTLSISTSCVEACSYTQGYFGNAGGQTCGGQTTFGAVSSALSSGNMLIGSGSRTINILTSEASCIIDKLPAGGKADLLPAGNATCSGANGNNYLKKGKFNNVLIGQTIVLGLNIRLYPNLGSIALTGNSFTTYSSTSCTNGVAIPGTGQTFSLPQSVLNCLGGNNTVADLFVLANKALGGTLPVGCGASISAINDAVDAINRGFDECRVSGGFSNNFPKSGADEGTVIVGDQAAIAYPNPFYSYLNLSLSEASMTCLQEGRDCYELSLYNLLGVQVGRVNIVQQTTTIEMGHLPRGAYFYHLNDRDGNAILTGKVISQRQ